MSNVTKSKTVNQHQLFLWLGALVVGAILGSLGITWLNQFFDFIATIYTRLFQFVAIPTIALAVITTLSTLGNQQETGRIFKWTITFTLLTTFAAAIVGLVLYVIISPGNLPFEVVNEGQNEVPDNLEQMSYYDHILGVIPNNILQPLLAGNVLSVLILAAAIGLALAKMQDTENKQALVKVLFGLQELCPYLVVTTGHRCLCGTILRSNRIRRHRGLSRKVYCGNPGRKLHPVLHHPSALSAGTRP